MLIADTTLIRAALSIIGTWDTTTYGRLNFDNLHGAWQRTGLRSSDLRDAVRILMERKLIAASNSARGMELALTEAGQAQARDDTVHLSSLLTDLRDVVNLKRARQRPPRHGGAPLSLERRRNDIHPEPS